MKSFFDKNEVSNTDGNDLYEAIFQTTQILINENKDHNIFELAYIFIAEITHWAAAIRLSTSVNKHKK